MTAAEDCPCEGSGWRQVTTKYAEHQANTKVPRLDEVEWTDADQRRWQTAYSTALNTVYPCKVHNAEAFWRWANGHFAADHDRAACVECVTPRGAKKRAKITTPAPPPPPEPTEDF